MSMTSTPIIPFDIDERIIDLLAEDDEDYSAIKTCSLVCRAFLPLCRKHIFASVVLNRYSWTSPTTPHTTPQLERLLSNSPEIAQYIRKLEYDTAASDFSRPSIHEFEGLKRISRLQYLAICKCTQRVFDWNSNPLRSTFLHLLHLPTLTHFKITSIQNFNASDLTPCVNLKKLDVGNYTTGAVTNTFSGSLPDRSIQLNELVVGFRNDSAIMNICTAQRPNGEPVIDFSSLAKIRVIFEYSKAPQELFRRCKRLTDVHISFWNPSRCCPSLSGMLQPAMQTLKYLNIATHVDGPDVDPLAGIPSELEVLRHKNIIEEIAIKVLIFTYDCREGDDWSRLEEVLMRPGWPELRQVLLTLEVFTLSKREPTSALENLPETHFRRLSASESVSFNFKIIRNTSIQKRHEGVYYPTL